MVRIRWEDLPVEVRHRIEDKHVEVKTRAAEHLPAQREWRCVACGAVSRSWAAAERHCDANGHGRVELIL